jgi:hypothetical protein
MKKNIMFSDTGCLSREFCSVREFALLSTEFFGLPGTAECCALALSNAEQLRAMLT